MKKIGLWLKIKSQAETAGRTGKTVIKKTTEMASELEKMGKLGGQLYVMRAG